MWRKMSVLEPLFLHFGFGLAFWDGFKMPNKKSYVQKKGERKYEFKF